ncbi:hypothetical protein O3G_MSEX010845 [Manduca sexta]|uniref:Replication factor C subunit 1 n=2 Tax=Manduca sexta TaxID=7130 RepID=A0A921ZJX0_MANSE|nr:hypothetical protein O3G_MSEX010845 [Manduca sexta]
MSRDIRSFFLPKKSQKPKDEDDDIIPESPDVQIKNKKKEPRKKRVIHDSDDETNTKKTSLVSNKSPRNKSKPDLKEVKVVDLFGNAPIKRTEPLVKKSKKQTETGIHSDDEFEKSLLEIDSVAVGDKPEIKQFDGGNSESNHKDTTTLKTPKNKQKAKSPAKAVVTSAKQNYANKKEESKLNSKRKFSEFAEIEVHNEEDNIKRKKMDVSVCDNKTKVKQLSEDNDDADVSTFEDESSSKHKKKKVNTSLNESVLTDEERHERKMHSAALYQKYLHRSGPKHLGAKEMPEGSPDCLKNCAFLLTGVLDSFEREEIVEAINKYSGCVKNAISKKVTHVLAGEDAGPAKMSKALELGIKIISEDDFLQMIADSKNSKNKTSAKNDTNDDTNNKNHSNKSKKSPKDKSVDKSIIDIKKEKSPKEKHTNVTTVKEEKSSENVKVNAKNSNKSINSGEIKKDMKIDKKSIKTEKQDSESSNKNTTVISDVKREDQKPIHIVPASMWVEKYKPQNVKQIIGQHGDASNVKKLTNWLTKWYVNRKAKLPKPSPWAKNYDGGYYKAALLSGPPGVGKTTTVSLVCKELGFDMVEYNASDTRNKTLIKEQIGEMLTTKSLSAYAKGDVGKQAVTKKHVLVMDEVDGMAGNEDRGGLQELINLIKMTSVPIICMCNDRNSQKMRSLVNYCYDLRFNRPRVDQIKSAMMSICFKEGLKVAPDVLSQLIVAANQDVRQTLNLLSMWAVDPDLADTDRLRKDTKTVKKDIKLGPWEAVRKVFSAEDHKSMSIHDKSDLFFYDYSLAPLFVQENYLQVAPHCPKHEVLQRISKAADSISLGDLVDKRIRSAQAWSLLPTQAMYSSVIPGHELAGHVAGQIQFPGWLGKNSRAGKLHRLCQEIHAHTRLSTSGSKSSIFLDYCTHLRDAIVNPLIKDKSDGIAKSLEVLESYHLLREDLDSLVELSVWPGQRNPTILIDSKVKAAMTRTYNKTSSALPYAPGTIKRGSARDDQEAMDDEELSDQPEDSDPENDALIKKKKTKETEKSSSSKEKPGASKEKPSSSKGKASNKAKKK